MVPRDGMIRAALPSLLSPRWAPSLRSGVQNALVVAFCRTAIGGSHPISKPHHQKAPQMRGSGGLEIWIPVSG